MVSIGDDREIVENCLNDKMESDRCVLIDSTPTCGGTCISLEYCKILSDTAEHRREVTARVLPAIQVERFGIGARNLRSRRAGTVSRYFEIDNFSRISFHLRGNARELTNRQFRKRERTIRRRRDRSVTIPGKAGKIATLIIFLNITTDEA